MKNLIILAALLIQGNFVFGQITDTTSPEQQIRNMRIAMYKAGNELKEYRKKAGKGNVIAISGAILAGGGAVAGEEALSVVGGAVSLIGIFIAMSSHAHIGNAGVILVNNGIAIPIEGKKIKK